MAATVQGMLQKLSAVCEQAEQAARQEASKPPACEQAAPADAAGLASDGDDDTAMGDNDDAILLELLKKRVGDEEAAGLMLGLKKRRTGS